MDQRSSTPWLRPFPARASRLAEQMELSCPTTPVPSTRLYRQLRTLSLAPPTAALLQKGSTPLAAASAFPEPVAHLPSGSLPRWREQVSQAAILHSAPMKPVLELCRR